MTGQSDGPGTGPDYATIKYDPDGNGLWVATYNAGSSNEGAHAVAVDAAGNVYVTGESRLGITFQADYATIKYDPDGNELWVARYNGPSGGQDIASALTLDADGSIYVTGQSGGDYATIKYDPDGNELWWRVTTARQAVSQMWPLPSS